MNGRRLRGLVFVIGSLVVVLLAATFLMRWLSEKVIAGAPLSEWRSFLMVASGAKAFVTATCICVGFSLAAIFSRGIVARASSVLALCCLLVAFAVLVDSIIPAGKELSSQSLIVRQNTVEEAKSFPSSERLVSIYFENGSIRPIGPTQAKLLLGGIKDCGATTVQLRGYASSAPYPDDPKGKNLKLANDRKRAIEHMLPAYQLQSGNVDWPDYDHMAQGRGYIDLEVGKPLKTVEALNRRVDILFSCRKQSARGTGM